MRRRRQKNTLLPKMLGVAVLVNAILLPILANLGVFKTIEQHLQPVTLVNLPPPEKKPPPPPPKRKPPRKITKAKPPPQTKVAARQTNTRPSRPNPNQPHVVASAAPAGSGAGDNTIDNSGTGTAGQVPTNASPPAAPSPVVTLPTPPPPAPEPAPAPHVPTLVAAQPLAPPRPDVPDDLRGDEMHAVLRGVFTVRADGTASFRVTQGTGRDELDRLALDYARRWTFQPATQDGAPVDSFLRVEIHFDVSA